MIRRGRDLLTTKQALDILCGSAELVQMKLKLDLIRVQRDGLRELAGILSKIPTGRKT